MSKMYHRHVRCFERYWQNAGPYTFVAQLLMYLNSVQVGYILLSIHYTIHLLLGSFHLILNFGQSNDS